MAEEDRFKDGKFLTSKAKYLVLSIAVILGSLFIISGGNPLSIIGWQKQPGALFEQRFYSGKYYVIISENQKISKEYKLVADIDRHIHCDPGNECGSLAYWVSTFYWPDGGSATFDTDTCPIGLQHESKCTDINGKDYSILMTSMPAS